MKYRGRSNAESARPVCALQREIFSNHQVLEALNDVILEDICLSVISKEAYVWIFLSCQIASHFNVLTGLWFLGGQARLSAESLSIVQWPKGCVAEFDILSFNYMFFWNIFSIVMHIFPSQQHAFYSHQLS